MNRCRFCDVEALVILSLVATEADDYSNEVVYCDNCGVEYERTLDGEYVR